MTSSIDSRGAAEIARDAKADRPRQRGAPCSACEGRVVLDTDGNVVFCAECANRAHDHGPWVELGGGD